jgi:hypothetical protein
MGNEHSSPHSGRTESPLSISSSPGIVDHPKIIKHRSLSPEKSTTPQRQARMSRYRASFRNGLPPPSSSNSSQPSTLVTINSGVESARLPRRTKSFRPNAQRAPTSFRLPTCQITGLTFHQKTLITSKWKEMDRATAIEYCRNVFETLFKREQRFLKVIDLQNCEEWKIHSNLRIHIRQFCDMLTDVIKHLNEPQQCLNSIREFGSSYATEISPDGTDSYSPRPHVPSAFWDALIFALNNAAKDMQVETSSRSSESPTSIDRRFLIPTPFEDTQAAITSSCLTLHSSSAPHMRRLLTNNYSNGLSSIPSSGGSVCPRAAEAWNLLAIFIVGQMRFAYELERLLQVEIKRLGISTNFSEASSPTSVSPSSAAATTQQQQQQNVQFSIA